MGELARKAQRLSESYDNWFLIVRPLELLVRSSTAPPSHFAAELMQMVEEASGGIRLGALSEVHAEVLMKTADDAAEAFEHSHHAACGSTLGIVQALAAWNGPARLWLMTRGAQRVAGSAMNADSLAESAWNLASPRSVSGCLSSCRAVGPFAVFTT